MGSPEMVGKLQCPFFIDDEGGDDEGGDDGYDDNGYFG